MSVDHCLGVDFGTSNSYFSDAPTEGAFATDDVVVGNKASIPTCVLYRKDTTAAEGILSFGDDAIVDWVQACEDDRNALVFSSGFKPDIAGSEEARTNAFRFLLKVRLQIEDSGILRGFGKECGRQVIFGIPATTMEGQKEHTKQIARDAGYGDVDLVPEPIGALLYHIAQKDVTIKEACRGILVIDFGGGTIDVAYLLRSKIHSSWGSPILGGRLFDDLFYQWFVEQAGGVELDEQIVRDRNFYYVHNIACRELKENFSRRMARGSIAKFSHSISVGPDKYYGTFRLGSSAVDEFFARSKTYTPSSSFLSELNVLQDQAYDLLKSESIDLIGLISDLLMPKGGEQELKPSDVERVILTGGSSRWPFMPKLVSSVYKLPEDRILQSKNPEATISRGLSLYGPLKIREAKVKEKLSGSQDELVEKIIGDVFQEAVPKFAANIADAIACELFDEKISPAIWEFRESGGKLNDLEVRLKSMSKAYSEDRLADVVNTEKTPLNNQLRILISTSIKEWLEEYSINPSELTSVNVLDVKNIQVETPDYSDELNPINAIVIGIVAIVAGSILGGGGMALLMGGPVGWLLGAVIGFIAIAYGAEAAKNIKMPSRVLKTVLYPRRLKGKLSETRKEFHDGIQQSVINEVINSGKDIYKSIYKFISEVIEEISITEIIP